MLRAPSRLLENDETQMRMMMMMMMMKTTVNLGQTNGNDASQFGVDKDMGRGKDRVVQADAAKAVATTMMATGVVDVDESACVADDDDTSAAAAAAATEGEVDMAAHRECRMGKAGRHGVGPGSHRRQCASL